MERASESELMNRKIDIRAGHLAIALAVPVIFAVGLNWTEEAPKVESPAVRAAFAPAVPAYRAAPDFRGYANAGKRKRGFFEYLRPIVEAENNRVRRQRERLLILYRHNRQGRELSEEDIRWLTGVMEEYGLEESLSGMTIPGGRSSSASISFRWNLPLSRRRKSRDGGRRGSSSRGTTSTGRGAFLKGAGSSPSAVSSGRVMKWRLISLPDCR